jgi:hypothetical protein
VDDADTDSNGHEKPPDAMMNLEPAGAQDMSAGQRCAYETYVVSEQLKRATKSIAEVLDAITRLRHEVQLWTDEELRARVVDPDRRRRYDAVTWQRTVMPLAELAVWPRVGGLPAAATGGSVLEAAAYVRAHGEGPCAPRLSALRRAAGREPTAVLAVCVAIPMVVLPYPVIHGWTHPSLQWGLDSGSHRSLMAALLAPEDQVPVLQGTTRVATVGARPRSRVA